MERETLVYVMIFVLMFAFIFYNGTGGIYVAGGSMTWREWHAKAAIPTILGAIIAVGVVLIAIRLIGSFFSGVEYFLEKGFDALKKASAILEKLGLTTLMQILFLSAAIMGGALFYQAIPKTREECVAREIRRMGQSSRDAVAVAFLICKRRFP